MVDARLTAAYQATVRVNGGSGVILRRTPSHVPVVATVHHVVKEEQWATVAWPGGRASSHVIARDSELDLALVDCPRDLEESGIDLAVRTDVGASAWLFGFPAGWERAEPVVSRGVVAGVGPRYGWIDGSGSWGHSGGPAVVLVHDIPLLIGVITADASRVHRELEELIARAREDKSVVDEFVADRKAAGQPLGPEVGLITYSSLRVQQVLELLRAHFRSGFLELVLAEDIARLRGA